MLLFVWVNLLEMVRYCHWGGQNVHESEDRGYFA
jgi:hypothetical protein